MRTTATFLLGLIASTAFVAPCYAITLVEKGKARAVIILPEKPSPVAEGAARVLRDHIKLISGAELPIRSEDKIKGAATQEQAWLLIGEGKLTDKLGLTSKGLGAGGIVLNAKGHVLALFGTDARIYCRVQAAVGQFPAAWVQFRPLQPEHRRDHRHRLRTLQQ